MEVGIAPQRSWLLDVVRAIVPFPCCVTESETAEIPMFHLGVVSEPQIRGSLHSYVVTIRTSKAVPNSGNSSPVWVVLVGESNRSEPIYLMHQLAESGTKPLSTSPDHAALSASSEAVFHLACASLGHLKYLVVGLDDVTEDPMHVPSWHLDYVKIVNQQGEEMFFPCNRWLTKDRDGGFLSRVLPLYSQAPSTSKCKYRVSLFTTNVKGARCDSEVSLTVYGSKGCSGSRALNGVFEKGAEDSFDYTGYDIGLFTSIRIGHNGKGVISKSWHLERVRVENLTHGTSEDFLVEDWFDRARGDGLLERDYFAPNVNPAHEQTLYKVSVYTGTMESSAKFDCNIFIELHGCHGQAGPFMIDHQDSFTSGWKDVFLIRSLDIGHVLAARVWHDSDTHTWVLEHLDVYSHSTRKSYNFEAATVFSKATGMGQVLLPAIHSFGQTTKLKMVFYTSDTKNAGTKSNVSIQIQGEADRTTPIMLENLRKNFQRGGVDEFRRQLPWLGKITQVAVATTGDTEGQSWHLQQLEITDFAANQVYFFPCQHWLGKGLGDEVMQLFPTSANTSSGHQEPDTCFRVDVKTSSLRGAGTDANVYCILYGTMGNTGRQPLHHGVNPFATNKLTTFFIYSTHPIGKLIKAVIGHDHTGLQSAWHVDHMEVVDTVTGSLWLFDIKSWIDKRESGAIAKEIFPAGLPRLPTAFTNFQITVRTSRKMNSGTSAVVEVVLIGSNGRTMPIPLAGERFERGSVKQFEVQAEEIGDVVQVQVTHLANKSRSSWLMSSLAVTVLSTGITTFFPHRQWFKEGNRIAFLQPQKQTDLHEASGNSSNGGWSSPGNMDVDEMSDDGSEAASRSKSQGLFRRRVMRARSTRSLGRAL